MRVYVCHSLQSGPTDGKVMNDDGGCEIVIFALYEVWTDDYPCHDQQIMFQCDHCGPYCPIASENVRKIVE